MTLKSLIITSIFLLLASIFVASPVMAAGEVLGIHVLGPSEVEQASMLLSTPDKASHTITVPLSFDDLNKRDLWQHFFDTAASSNLQPIVRFTTRFEAGSWTVPNRAEVIKMIDFLTAMDWHRDDMTVILFNEPNHAAEWGGKIDPQSYALIADFAADWLKTEPKKYIVLPAGMDLAAPNGSTTMEAFNYLRQVFQAAPDFVSKLDGWTSHSYPNPGFASSPSKRDKGSLRGYEHELAFLKEFTPHALPVYITETGWDQRTLSDYQVKLYYRLAYDSIWKQDPRIKTVTPFLLRGAPGTFAPFSFLDAQGRPTAAYEAYRTILNRKG